MIWTVGFAGTLSTDRESTVRPDPEAGEDQREPPAAFGASRDGTPARDRVDPLRDTTTDTDTERP